MAQPLVVSGADLAAAWAATGGAAAVRVEPAPAAGDLGPDGKPAFGPAAARALYTSWRLREELLDAAVARCIAYLEAHAGAA